MSGEQLHVMSGFKHLFAEIRGYVHYAISHRDDPGAQHRAFLAIEKITRQCTDLATYLGAMEAPHSVSLEAHSLSDLAGEAVRAQQHEMTDGSLTLVREFRANPTVLADAALLGQAVRTVLGICANLHASDTAGTITVSIDQDDENGVIAFTSGIAGDISPVDEARIPDICCKSMHERERDISLLGLAGVTKIMGLHHGSFIVDPGDGGNTTISLALPRHEDPPAPLPEPGAHGAPATKPGREISVLIADDDISIRELLKTVLSSIGVTRCDSAANGEEACMRAMENDYDLIFMDVSMPVLSGLDAFKKIRAVKPAMKIIFITGLYQEDEIVEKLYKDNAYGYIRKPFNIAEIKKIVTGI